MTKEEKLAILREFKEDKLRKKILIPLFQAMGFRDVIEYHGPAEKGKDIIFYDINRLGDKKYYGVVVKKDDIHGAVGKPGNAMEILFQIQQTFNEPYTDIYDLKELVIDQCFVVTAGEIKGTAIESISGTLKKDNLDKLVTFIDYSKLIQLLDTHLPSLFLEKYQCFQKYFKAMQKDFQTIKDVTAIGQRSGIPLERIYVSLKVSETRKTQDLLVEEAFEKEEKIFDGNELFLAEKALSSRERERVLEADTVLKEFRRIVIVGAPGAGKTTLLKHIAMTQCKENLDRQEHLMVPVPIVLRELIECKHNCLRDYVDQVFEKYGFSTTKNSVEKELKAGKCLLLLDGFDELATVENQEQIAKDIQAFSKNYPNCPMIVTSRVAGYHDELTGFTKLELMDFDDTQMKNFIDNWFGKEEQKKAQSMAKAIKGNETLNKLAKNPLMIAIIAVIYKKNQELPKNRVELYERTTEVLLSQWDEIKELKNKFQFKSKKLFLRKLAIENHTLNRRTMSEETVLEVIKNHLPQLNIREEQALPFLHEIWQRSFILRQIGPKTYDFLHLSFQEYFTALELFTQDGGVNTILEHMHRPWWEEPILLYAGMKDDATEMIKQILAAQEDIFYSNLMLAGKCAADARCVDTILKDDLGDRLWNLYREGEFELLRNNAIKVLSKVKPVKIIEMLLIQLTDIEKIDLKDAIMALGKISVPEAIPSLIKSMEKGKDSDVRSAAVWALGNIGGPEAIPALIKAMKIGKDDIVRAMAAEVLRNIGWSEAIPSLIKTMEKDKNIYVRMCAAATIGHIGGSETTAALIKVLEEKKDSEIRGRAILALGDIGQSEAIPILIKTMEKDKNPDVRWKAATALGRIGEPEALVPLIKTLQIDKASEVRMSAAMALRKIGAPETIPVLIKSMEKDKDSEVRKNAAETLGYIGSPGAIPALIKTVLKKNNNSSIRKVAIEALGNIGRSEAMSPLIKTMGEANNSGIRGSTVDALGKIGGPEAKAAIIKALENDKENYVRWTAARTLGKFDGQESVAALIIALEKDNDRGVRINSVSALGKLSSPEAMKALIKALENDEDVYVRRSAAFFLGIIGGPEAIGSLEKTLKKEEPPMLGTIKDAAFVALEKISRRHGIRIMSKE